MRKYFLYSIYIMVINNVLLLLIVVIIVVWFVVNIQDREKFDKNIGESPALYQVPDTQDIPTIPEIRANRINSCPTLENDLMAKQYIRKNLLNPSFCPRPVKSIKQFNRDFFDFRDKFTNENSSMRLDSVDKILNLYLSGNLGEARGFGKDVRIKDLFDQVTDCGNLNMRQCVRLPDFDNTMHDGYDASFVTGMSNVRDEWVYPGQERPINGGQVDNGIYPFDPANLGQMPAL